MLGGYPHRAGGMFELACRLTENQLLRPVQSAIFSLGGFPVTRAEKYLKPKILAFRPDYVVIQFASTDAQCPIRRQNPSASRSSVDQRNLASSYHSRPATAFSALRWEVVSLIGHLRKIDPITPLAPYVATIERMVEACRSAGATPVVLSPFVYGSRHTMKNAFTYTNALRDLTKVQAMILVDCLDALVNLPKSSILQHDGFHLSLKGHRIVGEAIAQAIILDACSRDVRPILDPECMQL